MRLVTALVIFLFIVSAAQAVFVDNKITDGLKNSDRVNVIVTMKTPQKVQERLAAASARVATDNTISALSSGEFRKGHDFGPFGGFSGSISASALEKLKNNPNVDSVYFDEPVHAMLAESAPLINATRAWQVINNGINVTGAGETVCIIDTGVNYNHSALGMGWGNKVVGGFRAINLTERQSCNTNNSACFDDHGHGSHVAGIVASNDSTNRGIAPDAKIVAIKALDSGGTGYSSDIIAGIYWCIANATAYNITVISMSLGTDTTYSSYCSGDAFASPIDAAVAANITVIVASGNGAITTGISSPACVQNAVAIGATYDANGGGVGYSSCSDSSRVVDAITCFTNRNSLLDLLAPGALTNSADYTGGFIEQAGTSMAAPMVSGAAALLHQYKRLSSGVNATPAQIENALKTSGKNVTDTGFTGLTFQRINILAALKTMDTTPSMLVVNSPANITYNSSNISLSYVVGDDIEIDRCWFTNTTGVNVPLNNGSGATCQNATFLLQNLQGNITVYANDTQGNTNASSIFFTLNIPVVTIQLPANGAVLNYNSSIQLNFTLQNISAIDKIWYNIDSGQNTTITGNATFNASEGNHLLAVYANNTLNITGYSTTNFTVDSVMASIIILSGPANEALNATNDFAFNVSLNENGTAVIEWNGVNMSMSGNGTAFNRSFTDVSDGNYTYRIYANDTAGNVNATSIRWVYVNATRNFSSYFDNLTGNLSQGNVTVVLLNSTGYVNASSVAIDINYTIQLNASGVVASIANFSWLNVNTSNLVNITRNVTIGNVSSNFTSSGGVLDSYVWVDMNNFTGNFTPIVSFPGRYRIAYYINGSRDAPESARVNATCDENITVRPCYSVGETTILYLSSFSGAAVGNDTQAPSITITSPSGTYSSSNISIACSATDNVGADSYWYSLNGADNVSIINCSATLSAASGSNTFVLYVNDSSGNTNSSTVSFTFSVPAPQQQPSGGGGGGSAVPPASKNFTQTLKKYLWDEINKSISFGVSVKDVPVTNVDLFVNSRALDVSATIMPSKNPGGRLDDTYGFFSVSFTNLPASKIDYAIIRFYVNRSWVSNYDKNNISLYRYTMGWDRLITTLEQENNVYYIYNAVTPGFSTFAIVGGKAPPPPPPEKLCAQVITAAVKDGKCALYSTPCDVPLGWQTVDGCPNELKEESTINNVLIFASFFVSVALIYHIVHHRSKRKSIEHRVHHHRMMHQKDQMWRDENRLYNEYRRHGFDTKKTRRNAPNFDKHARKDGKHKRDQADNS